VARGRHRPADERAAAWRRNPAGQRRRHRFLGARRAERAGGATLARLGRLSEAEFLTALAAGEEDGPHRRGPVLTPQIVMVVIAFETDARGNRCRRVFAVDDPAAAT
jgi:hypothetical protein